MWWEILKRQVASTKGKQFQLDFTQPMIEDEPCKEKLKNIFRRAHKKHNLLNIDLFLNDIDNLSEETACRILENRGKSGTLVKRQIASTKGKQFQLDFNQPMIEEEEENCKKKFLAVQDKLKSLTISGLTKADAHWSPYDQNHFYDEKRDPIGMRPELGIFVLFDESIPDEIYCKAIEQYENTAISKSILEDYGKYRILTEKRTLGKSRGNEEEYNFDNYTYDISIYLKDSPESLPLATTDIRHRIFYKGRYGDDGKLNPELDDKLEQIIQGALVF